MNRQLAVIHIIIWTFYFGSNIVFIDSYWYNVAKGVESEFIFFWFLSRFGDVLFAYIFSHFVFQKQLAKGKYGLFLLLLVGLALFHYSFDSVVWNWLDWADFFGTDYEQKVDLAENTVHSIMVGAILFASKNWTISHFRRKKLEDEVIETELKFLQSQMSPHFLFNVFNNIYSLSLDGNRKTTQSIKQLRSIMSYVQIFETQKEISLAEEESHLQEYISLNALRFEVKVKLESNFQDPSLKIEPMLFLPFFENAFKHGKTGKENKINAHFTEKNGVVFFEISNGKDPKKRKDDVSGVGLQNIKRRLPFLYSDFFLDVIEDDNEFKVKLRINIGEKRKK